MEWRMVNHKVVLVCVQDDWLWSYWQKQFLNTCLFDGGDLRVGEAVQITVIGRRILMQTYLLRRHFQYFVIPYN